MAEQVRLEINSQLPANDGEEVPVTGIIVFPADDHFARGFKTVGRTLRVRLSSDVLADLGQVLLDLARERRAAGDG